MTEIQMPYLKQINPGTSVLIPMGFYAVKIWAIGAGGSGKAGIICCGGGAGGTAVKLYTVSPGDWGNTLTASYGVGGTNVDGTASTVNGTLNGATITELRGGGGGRGGVPFFNSGGAGGTASGGDSNYPGAAGGEYDSENNVCGLGGVIDEMAGSLLGGPSTTGAGGNGDPTTVQGGFDGAIIFEWGYRE